MSDLTVRYDNVYLYCERKLKASLEWRLWLDTRETVDFEGLPVLIYEDIVWESPDGEDRYGKEFYAITIDDLPSDFIDKVAKVS